MSLNLPVTKDWLVEDVREGKVEPNPKGAGQLQKFYVDFEGSPDTYWRRKAGDVPEIGKTYYGTVREGDYGPMFKKEKAGEGGTSTAGGANFGSKEWTPEQKRDPERSARILRQHSQGVAVQMLAHCNKDGYFNVADVVALADELDEDVNQIGRKASQGTGSAGAPATGGPQTQPQTPGPSPAKSPELQPLLEATGMNASAAAVVANYLLLERTVQEQDTAAERLKNPNLAKGCVKRFSELAEGWSGEPLPTGPPEKDDDIPF